MLPLLHHKPAPEHTGAVSHFVHAPSLRGSWVSLLLQALNGGMSQAVGQGVAPPSLSLAAWCMQSRIYK